MKKLFVLGSIMIASLVVASVSADPDHTPPAAITDLTIAAMGPHTAVLTWTATGDDGTSGTASSYRLVYSTSPITDIHQSGLTVIPTGSPLPSGNPECASVTGLSPVHPYYFAIVAIDDHRNEGALSNTPNGTTPQSGNDVAC